LKPKKVPVADEAPPGYEGGSKVENSIVIGGSTGKVMAFNIETGETRWKYNCPGGWYKIPVVLVEPPSLEDGRPDQLIYVGCGKWVYCLKATDGDVLWATKVSNSNFGLNYMTLATPWSSRLAAEAYTAFSQNPTAQARDHERENENKSS
jgi:outer membrane protein assembly factor BamB